MDFTCRHSDTMHDFANTARHLETLSIKLHYPKSKEFSVPIMPTLKKLILYYREVHKDVLLPITCLIEAAPCLEEFKFEIIELDRKKGIFEVPKVGRFVHHHLKKFDFAGFCVDAPDHMELVKYVVNNCVALQSMTLVTQFMRRILNGRGVTVRDEEEEAFKLNARQAMRGLKGIVPRHITLFYGHLSCDATGKLMP